MSQHSILMGMSDGLKCEAMAEWWQGARPQAKLGCWWMLRILINQNQNN